MGNKIFTKSDSYKSEYCCTVVRVGEVKPIEGKDKIGYTLVNGETIVVRKDQVKEGDVLFYASNETQLDKDFLGANNLFESSCYEFNANAKEVEPYVLENKELKPKAEKIENEIKKLYNCAKFIINYEAELLAAQEDNDKKTEIQEQHDRTRRTIIKYVGNGLTTDSDDKTIVLSAHEHCAKIKAELEVINKKIEENTNFIRTHVGFFNKTGRVRAIRLGGVQSMGYLFSLDELIKYNPNVKDVNLEELVGEDFDTVEDKLFIKAYVPFVPEQRKRSKSEKRDKHIEKFDRMIKGEFAFHYDTSMFARNVNLFKPTDKVVISNKLHGTSGIFGKVHVKTPIKLPIHKWLWNKFVDITGLFKSKRITDYIVEYGNVTSSRTVIKNQYINKEVSDGYYGADVWSEYGNLIYPYLEEGMIVYGEICGYITNSDKMIQKGYDYGCEVGENFLMPYRITTANEDGTKKEWNVQEVYDWTIKLIEEHPELSEKIHPITIFYHGTLMDLYPDLSLTEHWHENLLEAMRNDKEHFGMEKNEPMCLYHKVPREGICIRKDDDEFAECFKLKCYKFLNAEAALMTEIAEGKEEITEEMNETYG